MTFRHGDGVIYAVGFKECNVGKWFSQTKVKSEYSVLINYTHEITIEITNSRFSRKRRVLMNGELVERFKRTNMSDFRYSWTYPVNDMVIVFSIRPNSSATGTDLLINGQDFFNFVYEVETDNPLGTAKGAYDTVMTFKVPPHDSSRRQRIVTRPSPLTTNLEENSIAPIHQQIHYTTIKANNYANLDDSFE